MERATLQRGSHTCWTTPWEKDSIHSNCQGRPATPVPFKPAQFLRIPHNQLPLLRFRTQATSYVSTHLHLDNAHTYTPYAERYCCSCLSLQNLGNEAHTLLTALIPLHLPNLQSIDLCSTFDNLIFGHGQPTQTPKK